MFVTVRPLGLGVFGANLLEDIPLVAYLRCWVLIAQECRTIYS